MSHPVNSATNIESNGAAAGKMNRAQSSGVNDDKERRDSRRSSRRATENGSRRHKKHKKHRKRRHSSSSDDDESDDSSVGKRERKRRRKRKSKSKSEEKRRSIDEERHQRKSEAPTDQPIETLHPPSHVQEKAQHNVPLQEPLQQQAKARQMVPMTKEQYEAKRAVIREEYDPESGRHRLVRGTGEILERIVSRDQHLAINRRATRGDGASFSRSLYRNTPSTK